VGWYVYRTVRLYLYSALSFTNGLGYLGAMLEEPIKEDDAGPPKMKGSAMLCGAKTKEEVMERLKRDVYVTGEVWVSGRREIMRHVCVAITDLVLGSFKGADYSVQKCHKEGVVVSLKFGAGTIW
jgi:hypothetical protein